MNIQAKNELTFQIVYHQQAKAIPVLSKDNSGAANGIEYSRIDIPNPGLSFPKTYLELFGSTDRLIGRYASENGKKDSRFFSVSDSEFKYAVTDSEIIDVLVTETGDCLKLTPDFITIEKKDASKIQYSLKGMKIIPSENKDIWVIGLDHAWLIDADFKTIKNFEWTGGINTISYNNTLICFTKSRDAILSLDKNGVTKTTKTITNYGFFENLVAYWGAQYITLEGTTFRWYEGAELKGELPLQSAGVLNNGDVFISYTKDKTTYLISNSLSQKWALPENFNNHILPIVFEKENAYFGYNLDRYCEFNKEATTAEQIETINENEYKKSIAPFRWKIGQNHYFKIATYNRLILSLTGPEEIILVEINNSF
ncbi:hypothetical protein [Flavobacterium poyangense]|uniref:hypothetical protein n=1 Tax=Flavobacterium poyangense TaxID=2204302 RepID=UPI0014210D22|nr:hypothetical protein [Flavobacterium sp. JXAS1]